MERTVDADSPLPDDFPLGYHWLTAAGRRRRLIVSPGRAGCPSTGGRGGGRCSCTPPGRAPAGGSATSATCARSGSGRSGRAPASCMVNPLHAVAPTLPQEPSPYLPATRRFRNPIYLCVEEVPGADAVRPVGVPRRGPRGSTTSALIDRDAVWRLKREALERVFAPRRSADAFEAGGTSTASRSRTSAPGARWPTSTGRDWRTWPAELRDPHGAGRGRVRRASTATRSSSTRWLQWAARPPAARKPAAA